MVFSGKKIFKNDNGDIHVGINAPEDFSECPVEEVKKTLENLNGRLLWRCTVCSDLSIAEVPPRICPTCFAEEAFVQINEKELNNLLEI
jgi:rubrerythrin